jgi:thymidylate synthase
MNPAFALAEIVWIIRGREDLAFLTHWNPKYPDFVGQSSQAHGAYGARLRKRNGVDQLHLAFQTLKCKPDSRQVVLQIWNSTLDLPVNQGAPQSLDIPCNIVSSLKLRDGRLHWLQVLRSNDVHLGMPHNFVQFTALQEIMAGWLGCEVGTYTHLADSLHLYESDVAKLGIDDAVTPEQSTDRFEEGYTDSETCFAHVESLMDQMVAGEPVSEGFLVNETASLPRAYANVVFIVAADHLRRTRQLDEAAKCVLRCNNPAYRQLWERWLSRNNQGAIAGKQANP